MSNQLNNKKLVEFKSFINKNPKLIKHIRQDESLLQTYFEKWMTLGPNDSYWSSDAHQSTKDNKVNNEIKRTDPKNDFLQQVTSYLEQLNIEIDMDTIEEQVHSFNKTFRLIQEFIDNFKKPTYSEMDSVNDYSVQDFRD